MSLTAAELLAWITGALLLQITAGALVGLWRYRRQARARAGTATAPLPAPSSLADAVPAAAWPGWRDFRVEHRQAEDPAGSQCSFHLVPVDGQPLPPFLPGQYLTFSLDTGRGPRTAAPGEAPADSTSITRCYSLSDRPETTRYRITVKRVGPPPGRPDLPPGQSSNHFHDRVQVGDVLRVRAPAGRFHIDAEASAASAASEAMPPAVLVAGGIGVTPMMSMLRWCLAEQPQRRLHLYYGLRNGSEHAFRDTLQALAAAHPNLQLHVAYSRPSEADTADADGAPRSFQHTGHVDIDLLRSTLPHGRHRFFVCGPPAMMETLVPALAAWGVARADLHFEAFGPASVQLPGDEVPAADLGPVEVRFERSGRTLAWQASEGTLLEFAERHGIAVDSGCRTGGCGTCQTRVLSGEIRHAHPPDHDVAPGCGLLCIGRPATALVLEA